MYAVMRRGTAWGLALVTALSLGGRLFAAEPAEITFPDGTTREGAVVGFGAPNFSPPVITGTDPEGASVSLALDKVAAIKDTTKDGALVVLRNGEEHRLTVGALVMAFQSQGGAVERVPLAKVQAVTIRYALRKDKKGNAMQPDWLYSPYTGEKLPEATKGQ
jgi:hypothetical protein